MIELTRRPGGPLTRLAPAVYAGMAGLVLAASSHHPLFALQAAQAEQKTPSDDQGRDDRANQPRPDVSALFSQPGDDPPQPFVPLRAATVEDRGQVEIDRLYTAARALEDRGSYNDAVELLLKAQKLAPDSLAILRRLCRIYIGALAKPELAVEYGKKVLALEPGDTDTLSRLVEYFLKKNETDDAEKLLKEVLANPKLDEHAPGRLLAQDDLGKLYAKLNQMDKAAVAFAEVMKALDDKTANRLTPVDQARILGNEPASAYLGFGMVFLAAKKNDLAIRAFERGLIYDEGNPRIPLLLAETLLKENRGQQALALVERYIKRQPQALEAYELEAKVLKALHREAEITPRLEEAARRDSKNVPLQYILADRYRETGQVEKAEAIYKSLLTSEPTPQTYRALANSLLKRRKAADLLKVICEVLSHPNGRAAVRDQLQAAANDDEMAEAMLDAGLTQLQADPPGLPPSAYLVLQIIANPERGKDKPGRLKRLVKVQKLLLERSPSPLVYRELATTLRNMEQYDEAATTLLQMIEKYPSEKNGRTLAAVADLRRRAGKTEKALAEAREASGLDPNDAEVQLVLADLLGDLGKIDEALEILQKLIKNEPDNARYRFVKGGMLAKFGRNDEAVKVFQELIKQFASNDEIVKLSRSNLSIVYVNQGDYAKGEAELEAVIQKTPDDPGVNNDLGYLYAEQGKNLEKAEAMIRKAVREEPDRPAYLDSLGWVLFKRGKVKEALEPLQKAVDLQKLEEKKGAAPPDATIREHLGDVFLHLKDVDKAREIWLEAEKIAAKAVPPDKRLPEIRKKLDSLKQLGSLPKASTNQTP